MNIANSQWKGIKCCHIKFLDLLIKIFNQLQLRGEKYQNIVKELF
jgi:hypothetical protein